MVDKYIDMQFIIQIQNTRQKFQGFTMAVLITWTFTEMYRLRVWINSLCGLFTCMYFTV